MTSQWFSTVQNSANLQTRAGIVAWELSITNNDLGRHHICCDWSIPSADILFSQWDIYANVNFIKNSTLCGGISLHSLVLAEPCTHCTPLHCNGLHCIALQCTAVSDSKQFWKRFFILFYPVVVKGCCSLSWLNSKFLTKLFKSKYLDLDKRHWRHDHVCPDADLSPITSSSSSWKCR